MTTRRDPRHRVPVEDRVLAWLQDDKYKNARGTAGIVAVVVLLGVLVLAYAIWGGPITPAAQSSTVAEPIPSAQVVAPAPSTAAPLGRMDASVPAPMVAAAVDKDVAPAPGMDPKFAPPDGPMPDVGPFQIDPQSMREEFETHGVTTSDEQLAKLVTATNAKIAEGIPDLQVWDPEIKQAIQSIYPDLDRGHQIDLQRCAAEYVERIIARNLGWKAPPDSTDDHNEYLDGRGPQPRVDVKQLIVSTSPKPATEPTR